ncbi:hypothetical protein LTS18_009063, partial [Coniosporium uncinatum]
MPPKQRPVLLLCSRELLLPALKDRDSDTRFLIIDQFSTLGFRMVEPHSELADLGGLNCVVAS